jgi:hypothetical protein
LPNWWRTLPAARRGRHAAQQRLDAREQLGHLERLGEVVVGAELQPDDAVEHLGARGEHQDGRRDAALPQRPAHVEPVAAGQHDVEHDRSANRSRDAMSSARSPWVTDSTS